jgi:hypothetical protein
MSDVSKPQPDSAIDIETLGVRTGSVVLSVGLVIFERESDRIVDTFYRVINMRASLDDGWTQHPSTVEWWAQQPEHVRQEAMGNPQSLPPAQGVCDFIEFVERHRPRTLWANHQDFDLPLWKAYVDRYAGDEAWPYHYGAGRDMPTLIEFTGVNKREIRPEGDKHNALTDALWAARVVQACYARKPRPRPESDCASPSP